ncbi:hypothetical protein MMC11_001480 [Xylographa trunciseda]|nr:hypothetical protein [Xylographa trunciseda]
MAPAQPSDYPPPLSTSGTRAISIFATGSTITLQHAEPSIQLLTPSYLRPRVIASHKHSKVPSTKTTAIPQAPRSQTPRTAQHPENAEAHSIISSCRYTTNESPLDTECPNPSSSTSAQRAIEAGIRIYLKTGCAVGALAGSDKQWGRGCGVSDGGVAIILWAALLEL